MSGLFIGPLVIVCFYTSQYSLLEPNHLLYFAFIFIFVLLQDPLCRVGNCAENAPYQELMCGFGGVDGFL